MTERDVDLNIYRRRLESDLAEVALERGRWHEAMSSAQALLRARTASVVRLKALTVAGRLRARRGDPDPWTLLDEALGSTGPQTEREQLDALHAARMEAAWLGGDTARASAEADAVMPLRLERLIDPWWRGELGFWAWRCWRARPNCRKAPPSRTSSISRAGVAPPLLPGRQSVALTTRRLPSRTTMTRSPSARHSRSSMP